MLLFSFSLDPFLSSSFLVILKNIIEDIFTNSLNFDLDLIMKTHKETEQVLYNFISNRETVQNKLVEQI